MRQQRATRHEQRGSGSRAPVIAAALVLSMLSLPGAHGNFELSETFTGRGQLALLQRELEVSNFAAAAARVEWMLEEHGHELMQLEGGRLISFPAWLAALPQAQREGLRLAFGQRLEGPAVRRLAQMRSEGVSGPEAWYALARRYPFSKAAAEALVLGAELALERGDLSTAGAMFELASRKGWKVDSGRRELIERLEPWRLHHRPEASPEKWHGPLPFDARWYGNADAVSIWRFIPYTSDRLTFVAGSRRVFAFRPNGAVAWQWEAAKPWIERLEVNRPLDLGRGPVWSIAAVSDETGAAQMLVMRQLRSSSTEGCIRAFRAADGKLLWSTENEQMNPLLVLSEPAVAGGHVYFVAVDSREKGEELVVAAVNVMTGALAWTSVIGRGPGIRDRRDGNHDLEAFWSQTAPVVDEEHVYVAPNVGRVVAVGRFDGQVRWSAAYPASQRLPRRDAWRQYREHRLHGRPAKPPVSEVQLLRWTNSPVLSGGAVVVAPPDVPAAFAMDRRSGEVLWEKESPDGPVLLGAAGERVIFGGERIVARDVRTGEEAWLYKPPGDVRITGPAVVLGERVHVPVSSGVVTLAAEDGAVQRGVRTPNFRAILASAAAKAALEELEAASSFGTGEP
jgi:outer membrane protein assembly factor BamB